MTIAITAPQKFDFQDAVCIEMMLRFASIQSAEFYVEPDGGEDGELRYPNPGGRSTIEIQVKGAAGPVSLAVVASCLAHTPSRSADNTLLERLIGDPERIVVLVMSGRAEDAVLPYIIAHNWNGYSRPPNSVTAAHAKALLDAFGIADVAGSDTAALKGQRQAHNAAFSRSVNPHSVRSALARLVVIEQLDEVDLESRCIHRLIKDWLVPGDRAPEVLRTLRAAVKKAKSAAQDAYPLIRRVLASATPEPLCPVNYVQRGDENSLVQTLSRDGTLLLSGTPRVGKTFVARWVAADFRQHGYDVQDFDHVDRAERFLLDSGPSLRLAMLDDPLGGSQIHPDATRSLARIERLASHLPANRKLVVAQGLEPLLETSRSATLDGIRTGRFTWRNVGELPSSFLVAIWRSLASTYGVDARVLDAIQCTLSGGGIILEPGCLEYLAVNWRRLPNPCSADEAIRLAREDAMQLGRALAAEGREEILAALAISTKAQKSVGMTELAFVRGEGGSTLPGIMPDLAMGISIGGERKAPEPLPGYRERPILTPEDLKGLDALERRRLIAIERGQSIAFLHPFYRAAAESLIQNPTYLLSDVILTGVGRGLLCISAPTSRATAENLDWIYKSLGTPDLQERLVDQAIEGLQSCFPATRVYGRALKVKGCFEGDGKGENAVVYPAS